MDSLAKYISRIEKTQDIQDTDSSNSILISEILDQIIVLQWKIAPKWLHIDGVYMIESQMNSKEIMIVISTIWKSNKISKHIIYLYL